MIFHRITNKLGFSILSFVLLLVLSPSSYSQTKTALEQQRKQLLKDISLTNKMLKETNKDKEAAMDQYLGLKAKIEKRELLIETIQSEIKVQDASIAKNKSVILSLQKDQENLLTEYSAMLRQAFRYKMNKANFLLIIASNSFNQAFRRWRYFQQYESYRRKQVDLIGWTSKMLETKVLSLEEGMQEKEQLLIDLEGQRSTLGGELVVKNKMVYDIKSNLSKLEKTLKDQKKSSQKLNSAIAKIIEEAIKKQQAGAVLHVANKKAEIAYNSSFGKKKGNLPWPVEAGVITKKFGKQKHPTLRKILIENNGIDIRTEQGAIARCVFEGKVSSVQYIPGYSQIVIIDHGNYYSVYSNLNEVYVVKGEKVKALATIGTVKTNPSTKSTELHFEIWKGKKHQNPSKWITRK